MKWKVLVFPGGTEVGLEIMRSLKSCKEVKLYSATNHQLNHAEYVYQNHVVIPDVRQNDWFEVLNETIKNHQIDFIYPANPFVIDALISVRDKLNCEVIMSSTEVMLLTRSKRRTLSALKNSVAIPKEYSQINDIDHYPIFVKPDNSYGEQGAGMINSHAELEARLKNQPNLLLQEVLVGDEYTIDCFSDKNQQLLFCAARIRERIRMGTSMHGELVEHDMQNQFKMIAKKILEIIPLNGAWFFQMKKDQLGTLKLLEVEARIAGTMALNRVRGINFPLLSLFLAADVPISVELNNYTVNIDRALTNRYQHNLEYQNVYVDLDDTLILHNKLNLDLISFLYQCVNNKIKIILLSKSLASDKIGLLKQWRIHDLFDEIFWLEEHQSKADYIKDKSAIFIDDSFSQRRDVAKQCGIATFDGSMIEMLIDERV